MNEVGATYLQTSIVFPPGFSGEEQMCPANKPCQLSDFALKANKLNRPKESMTK